MHTTTWYPPCHCKILLTFDKVGDHNPIAVYVAEPCKKHAVYNVVDRLELGKLIIKEIRGF